MRTDKPSTMARIKSDDYTLSQGALIVAKGEHDLDDSNSEMLMVCEAQDGGITLSPARFQPGRDSVQVKRNSRIWTVVRHTTDQKLGGPL